MATMLNTTSNKTTKTQKPPKQLLFLSCDGLDGRHYNRSRKELRRHVQLDYRLRASSPSADIEPRTGAATLPVTIKWRGVYPIPKKSATTPRPHRGAPLAGDGYGSAMNIQPRGFDPFSSLAVTAGAEEMLQLLTWHLFPGTGKDGNGAKLPRYLMSFKRQWWGLAMEDEGFGHALLALIMRFREALTGEIRRETYYRYRGRAIQALQRRFQNSAARHPPSSRSSGRITAATALTITLLSDLAIYEQSGDERANHLHCLQNIASESLLTNVTLHATHWFAIVTTILKYSLWVPDALPTEYLLNSLCRFDLLLARQPELERHASQATLSMIGHLPSCTTSGSDLDQAGLFRTFQLLFLYNEIMAKHRHAQYGATMGVFYTLAHRMTTSVSNAHVLLLDQPGEAMEEVYCVLLAAQLSTWALTAHNISSRCQSSIDGTVRVCRRLVHTLQRRENVIEHWRSVSSLEALVWVLFVGCAFTRLDKAEGGRLRAVLCPLLSQTLNVMDRNSAERFEEILRLFPWVPCRWSDAKLREVWAMLAQNSFRHNASLISSSGD